MSTRIKRSKMQDGQTHYAPSRGGTCELKSFDYNPTGAAVNMTAATTAALSPPPFFYPLAGTSGGCINQVPVGASSITRIGRRILNTKVLLSGRLYLVSVALAKVSVFLIWDRAVNNATALPPWTTILNSQTSVALPNRDYEERFTTLRRWNFSLSSNPSYQDNGVAIIDEEVQLDDKYTIFSTDGTSGLYPTMEKGALLLYVVSDVPSSFNIAINTRVYFEDC